MVKTPAQVAVRYWQRLLACYRVGAADHADAFTLAAVQLLCDFDEVVLDYVTDPRTGLPGELKFFPTIAEIKAACVKRAEYLERQRDLERRYAGRKPLPMLQPPEVGVQRLPRGPGFYANVRIDKASPQYPDLLKWTNTADPLEWRIDDVGELWVSLEQAHWAKVKMPRVGKA